MSKRYLVEYNGPLEEYVAHVNGKAIRFFPITISGETASVGEVYSQRDYEVLLKDSHLSPYVPCLAAIKILNKLQAERAKSIEEAEKADKVTRLETQILQINQEVDRKQEEAISLITTAKSLEVATKDLLDFIPKIEQQIKDLLGIKKGKK